MHFKNMFNWVFKNKELTVHILYILILKNSWFIFQRDDTQSHNIRAYACIFIWSIIMNKYANSLSLSIVCKGSFADRDPDPTIGLCKDYVADLDPGTTIGLCTGSIADPDLTMGFAKAVLLIWIRIRPLVCAKAVSRIWIRIRPLVCSENCRQKVYEKVGSFFNPKILIFCLTLHIKKNAVFELGLLPSGQTTKPPLRIHTRTCNRNKYRLQRVFYTVHTVHNSIHNVLYYAQLRLEI